MEIKLKQGNALQIEYFILFSYIMFGKHNIYYPIRKTGDQENSLSHHTNFFKWNEKTMKVCYFIKYRIQYSTESEKEW
jgi:hypothetical protein